MANRPAKLTDYELAALSLRHNLADGHARHDAGPLWDGVLRRIRDHLTAPNPSAHGEIEREFAREFFTLARQQSVALARRMLFCGSASMSIEIVANYLRLNKLSAGLMEPTFDNLADILRRHHVPLQPIPDAFLTDHDLPGGRWQLDADACFLVVPNNPTGTVCSEAHFTNIVNYCAANKMLLIVDFSFRLMVPGLLEWDQYAILDAAGVRYIAIEDTGKVWPTHEIKVSIVVADPLTHPLLQAIYTDIFLNLSPLNFILLTEFIRDSQRRGLDATLWEIYRHNRTRLRAVIAGAPLRALILQP